VSLFHRHRGLTPYLLLAPGVLFLTVFFLVPLGFLAYQSLESGNIDFGYTFTWAWSNYSDALHNYRAQFIRSITYAGIATLLALVISYPVAYWIAFRGGRWKNLLLLFIVAPFFRKVPEKWVTLGKPDDFQIGKTVAVTVTDPSSLPWAGVTAKSGVWLRRVSEDSFIAFSANCMHLGCPVRWLEDAELFWITTVRVDGRPHVTPLVAVWLDDAIHFATGAGEQQGFGQELLKYASASRAKRRANRDLLASAQSASE